MSAYRTETHVKLTYEMQREDYVRAIRGQRSYAILRVALPWLVGVLAVLFGLMWLRVPLEAAAAVLALLALFYGVLMTAALRIQMRHLDKHFEDRRSQRLEVTEDAVELHDRVSGKRIVWELVLHWRETADDFLIYVTPQLFHVIPKRVLPNPEVETAFRRLLQDRVAAGGEAKIAAARARAWIPFVVSLAILGVLLAAMLEAVAAILY